MKKLFIIIFILLQGCAYPIVTDYYGYDSQIYYDEPYYDYEYFNSYNYDYCW